MDKAIIVDHLSYSNQLKDVSFTIQSGEMVGIVGPNESGKTTIFKILSGLLKSSSGFVSVLDYDPYLRNYEFLKQISFLVESKMQLVKNMAPIDSLEITKEIYGLSGRDFGKNLNKLAKYISDPILLDTLIYKPKIVLLDKPNIDLNQIYEYSVNNEAIVMIAKERIDDLIGLVRRIIILNEGKVLFDGAIDEIIEKYAKEKLIKIRLLSEINLKDIEDVATIKKYVYPNLHILSPRSVASYTSAELLQRIPVASLIIEELPIEEIIKNMNKWLQI